MNTAFTEQLNALLRAFLWSVVELCNAQEQTTHGRIRPVSSFKDVATDINTALGNPTPFNISELCSGIEEYLRTWE